MTNWGHCKEPRPPVPQFSVKGLKVFLLVQKVEGPLRQGSQAKGLHT